MVTCGLASVRHAGLDPLGEPGRGKGHGQRLVRPVSVVLVPPRIDRGLCILDAGERGMLVAQLQLQRLVQPRPGRAVDVGPPDSRCLADRLEKQRLLRELFGWVAMHEGGWERARDVQQALTEAGQHRSAGAADLLIAVTAEWERLVILCDDRDYLGTGT